VSKDCRKIADAVASLQFLWSGVFESVVIFAVLLGFITYNALPALGVFLLLLPLQYKLGLWIAQKKAEISTCSSERAQVGQTLCSLLLLSLSKCFDTCTLAPASCLSASATLTDARCQQPS
jgi:hypothetical protein